MTKSDRISHAIGILSILVTIAIAAVAAVSSKEQEKSTEEFPVNLVYSIRDVFSTPRAIDENSSNVEISLIYRGRAIENGSIVDIDIRNRGKKPIRPEDTYEPINVKGGSGLQIVDVEPRGGIRAEWIADKDGVFKTKPLLLNSSDRIGIRVFLKPLTSNAGLGGSRMRFDIDEGGRIAVREDATVIVNARIAGLSKVQFESSRPTRRNLAAHWYFVPFTIALWSWAIPFLVVSFLTYFWFYMYSAHRLGSMTASISRKLGITLSSASLSLWAAEAGASILQRSFPDIGETFDGGLLSMNLPPVAVNALIVSIILWKLRKLTSLGNTENLPELR